MQEVAEEEGGERNGADGKRKAFLNGVLEVMNGRRRER